MFALSSICTSTNKKTKNYLANLASSIVITTPQQTGIKATSNNYIRYKQAQTSFYYEDTFTEISQLKEIEFTFNFIADAYASKNWVRKLSNWVLNRKVSIQYSYAHYTEEALINAQKLLLTLGISPDGDLYIFVRANPQFVSEALYDQIHSHLLQTLQQLAHDGTTK